MKKNIITIIFILFYSTIYGQNNRLIIQDVAIIPLHINKILKNRDVIIENGVIIKIRNHIDNDTVKYDLGRINAKGKYLIPSFSDAHSHLPEEKNLNNYFLMNLANGVTTLRSMRGEMWHIEINEKDKLVPKLILSSPPISWRDSIFDAKAKQLIADYKNAGFDFVKILSVKDKSTLDLLIKYSKLYNLKLAGHCPSNVDFFYVLNSGVYQSIEHLGGFMKLRDSKKIVQAVNQSIEKQVYNCPTLDWYFTGQVLEDSLRKREGVEFIPQELVDKWEKKIQKYYSKTTIEERKNDREKSKAMFSNRLAWLNYIYRQGGLLLLSPDASGLYSIPGFGMHTEMQHFTDAGISNFDVLKAACYNLSVMLGEENDWGTIKVGTSSDLVLLNKNPLEDIKNTKEIEGIIFKGEYYTQKELVNNLKYLKSLKR